MAAHDKYDFWFAQMASGIDDGMRNLRDYLDNFNAQLTRMSKDFESRVAQYRADDSDDEYGYFADQLTDEAMQLDFFEKLLRNSTLASIVTYFELQAVTLTRTDFRFRKKGDFKTKKELEVAAKKEVQRFEHLTKYWRENGLAFHEGAVWNEICLIGKVRNKIAHTNGQLGDDGDSKTIREYVARRQRAGNVSLTIQEELLIVEPEYCFEVMKVYRQFLIEIIKSTSDLQ